MNKWRVVLGSLLVSFGLLAHADVSVAAGVKDGDRVPGVLIVQFSQNVVPQYAKRLGGTNVMGVQSLDMINSQYGLQLYARLFPSVKSPAPPRNLPDLTRYHKLYFPTDVDLDAAAAAYRADPNVASVEFDAYVFMQAVPNDSLYPQMWNLSQSSDHDIDADQAWDVAAGSPTIVLGVTDTGVLYSHEDLNGSIWVNPGEDLDHDGVVMDPDDMNGIDDDGNGYVDDLIGWDFVQSPTSSWPPWPGEDTSVADNDPRDFNGHGTHVSGTIAGMTNNIRGISGIAGGFGPGRPGCKIMCLRMGWSIDYYGGERGLTAMSYVAEAFVYAANMGARAINYSFGSLQEGGIEAATDYAVGMGVTICASAGNNGSSGGFGYIQSRPDVICVASTDEYDGKSSFSNYGGPVDISAPGSDIWSSVSFHYTPGYAIYSGTSMATPHVVGLTGLILSVNPGLTRAQVRDIIVSTADSTTNYIGQMGGGRINAYKAVLAAKAFRISHVPLANTADTLNPYRVVATIVSDTTLRTDSLALFYRSSNNPDTSYIRVPLMATGNLNEYAAPIPAQPVYSLIQYGMTAEDDRGERVTSPTGFPGMVYSFHILGVPLLAYHPDSFAIELPSGYTRVESLVVRNDGTDNLKFTVQSAESTAVVNHVRTSQSLDLPWPTNATPLGATEHSLTPANLPPISSLPLILTDPVGDDIANGFKVDIVAIRGRRTATEVILAYVFTGSSYVSNANGYLSLDTDRDPSTGVAPPYGRPAQTVGAEYFVWLSPSAATVYLYDQFGNSAGMFPMAIADSSYEFAITLASLGNPSSDIHMCTNNGDYGPEDWAPDAGYGVISTGTPLLTISPDSGTVAPRDSQFIELRCDARPIHRDTTAWYRIELRAKDSLGSVAQIPVRIHVLPPDYYVDLSPTSAAQSGLAGDTVWYADTLTNYGAITDFYHLSILNTQWPATIWDASGASQITVTPALAMNERYIVRLRVIVPVTAPYGLQDTLQLIVTSNGDPSMSRTFEATTGSGGPLYSIPWSDRFESATLDTLHWQFSKNVEVNSLGLNPPSPPYSLNLNGYPSANDMVTSVPIDLSRESQVMLSYWFEETGSGETPDQGDDLLFEILDSAHNWIEVSRQYGNWIVMNSFEYVELVLPEAAYHSEFRLRIRSLGTSGPYDDWFVDDVMLYRFIPPSVCHAPDSFSFTLSAPNGANDTLAVCNNGPGNLKFWLTLYDSTPGLAGTAFPRVIPSLQDEMFHKPPQSLEGSATSRSPSPPLGSLSLGLRDNFEDGNFDGWFVRSPWYTREVTSATAAAGTHYSFQQAGGAYELFDGVSHDIPAGTYSYVGFYIRLNSNYISSGCTVIGDQYTTSSGGAIFFYAGANGRFVVTPGDASFPYQAKRWYKVEFYLNWDLHTFDYYVDGKLVAPNLPFNNPTSYISQVHLFNYAYSTTWWDEMVVGDGPMAGGWLTVSPHADTLAPGETSFVNLLVSSKGVPPGNYLSNLRIESNDPVTPQIGIPVSLRVRGPEIDVRADSIADSLDEGASVTDTIWVHNIGEEELFGSTISTSDDWITVYDSPYFPGPAIQTPVNNDLKSHPATGQAAAVGRRSEPRLGIAPGDSVPLVILISAEILIAGENCGAIAIGSNDFDEPETRVPVCLHVGPDPHLVVTPESLITSLVIGDSLDTELILQNTGAGTLGFTARVDLLGRTIQSPQSAVQYPSSYYQPSSKDAPDVRVGRPVTQGSGGPDSAGYTWMDSDEPGGPVFNWQDISSTGTPIVSPGMGNYYGPFSIGFDFPFYDSTYSQFWISAEGFIGFGPPVSYGEYWNEPIPYQSAPNNIIAWYWDILYPYAGDSPAEIHYQREPGRLIVQYSHFRHAYYSFGPTITGEIIIDKRGNITLQTLEIQSGFPSYSATVGIEDITGRLGLQMAFNTPYVHDRQSIRITRAVDWLTVAPDSGVIHTGDAMPLTVHVRAENAVVADYHANIILNSNDPFKDSMTIPARMHIRTPKLSQPPDTILMYAAEGMTSDSTLWLCNRGDAALHARLSDNAGWLSCLPDSVTIAAGESLGVDIRATAADLLPGRFSATITITSDAHLRSIVTVPVVLDVGPDPDVVVTPDSFAVVLNAGDSLRTSMQIENQGQGTLRFEIETEIGADSLALWSQIPRDTAARCRMPLEHQEPRISSPGSFGSATSTRRFALVQDWEPSGGWVVRDLLSRHGIAYDIWGSGNFGTVDLSRYDKIIIGSFQPESFYSELITHRTWFEEYVRNGGNLEMNLATYGSTTLFSQLVPGEFTVYTGGCYEFIGAIDSQHPLLTTPNVIPSGALDYWWCSAYGILGSYPPAAKVILINSGDMTPVCAEVRLGGGTVLATTQPVDFYWSYYPYLENMLLYHSYHRPWVTVSPDTGRVAGGQHTTLNVEIRNIGIREPDSYARLRISTNDPDRSSLAVPVHLHKPSPSIEVRPPDSMAIAATEGGMTTDTLWVANRGDGALYFRMSADKPWLVPQPPDPEVAPGESVSVPLTVDASSLLPGRYRGTLTVFSNDHLRGSLSVTIVVDVGPDPMIVLPESLTVNLARADSIVVPFVVSNSGLGTLCFTTEIEIGAPTLSTLNNPYPESYYHRLAKGEPDTRVGHKITKGIGGPDSAGYWWIDSDQPGGPAFNWVDISTTGTPLTGFGDDNYLGPLPVGFSFPFYDASYSQFWISSNGFIGFGPPYGYYEFSNSPIPNAYDPNNFIAWFWDDLYEYTGSQPTKVYYQTSGDQLIVQFDRVRHCCGDGPWISAEVILTRSGRITIQYREIAPGFDGSSSIGIEDRNGQNGLEVAFNTPYVHNALALTISRVPQWLVVVPDTGRVAPGGFTMLAAHVSGHDMQVGDYIARVLFHSNDPVNPVATLPVRLGVVAPRLISRPDSICIDALEKHAADSTLCIRNAGTGLLRVVIQAPDSVVIAIPDSAEIAPNDSLAITIRANATHLIPGWYTRLLTVRSNDFDRPEVDVPVAIHVGPDPQILVLPDSLLITVVRDDSASTHLSVANEGQGTLVYTTKVEYALPPSTASTNTPYPPAYYDHMAKDVPDPRIGRPVTLGGGGPDATGYSWIDSDDPAGPVFNWMDISTTGTAIVGLGDDNFVGPFPIGFPFRFYDSVYTQFWVSSNGFIGFGPTASYDDWSNTPLPASTPPNNIIAWFWDDLYAHNGGNPTQVFYQLEADSLVVQISRMRHYCCANGPWMTADIILHKGGAITMQYAEVQPGFPTNSGTVGIESPNGLIGLDVAFNTPYIHSQQAILITRYQNAWMSLAPGSGYVNPDAIGIVRVKCKSTGLEVGDRYARILFFSNDPDHDTVSVPVHLIITGGLAGTSVLGDLNGDGALDIADIQALLGGLFPSPNRSGSKAASAAPTTASLRKTDVNGDGITDIRDVVEMIRMVWASGSRR